MGLSGTGTVAQLALNETNRNAPKLNLMLPNSSNLITSSLPMQSKLLSASSAVASNSASPSQMSKLGLTGAAVYKAHAINKKSS